MVQGDTEAQAFQDGAVGAQPFPAKRDSGAEDVRIGLEERAQGAPFMQVDNDIRKRLDAAPLGAEDQDRLAIIDKPPGTEP